MFAYWIDFLDIMRFYYILFVVNNNKFIEPIVIHEIKFTLNLMLRFRKLLARLFASTVLDLLELAIIFLVLIFNKEKINDIKNLFAILILSGSGIWYHGFLDYIE